MRNVGDMMEDLMGVWKNLDQTQKAALSQSLAGKYQVARFQALMNRSDLYDQYKGASENANGTLDTMSDKYVNSLEGRMNKLQASAEGLFNDLFDTEDFYAPVDALTQLVDLTDQFVNALGGVKGMLSAIAPVATQVFAKNIGQGISNAIYNNQLSKLQNNNKNQAYAKMKQMGIEDVTDRRYRDVANLIQDGQSHARIMTDDQQKQYNSILEDEIAFKKESIDLESKLQTSVDATNSAYKLRNQTLSKDLELIKDEEGNITGVNTAGLQNVISKRGIDSQLDYNTPIDKKAFASYKADVNTASESFADNLAQIGNMNIAEAKKYMEDYIDEVFGAIGTIEELTKAHRMNNAENQEAVESVRALVNVLSDEDATTSELQTAYQRLSEAMNAVEKTTDGYNSKLVKTQDELNSLSSKLQQTESAFDAAKARGKAFVESISFASAIAQTLQFAGAVGNLAFAFQQIKDIGDIWDDDDLTSGEKLLQTLMSIGTIAPMVAQSLSTFKNILSLDSIKTLTGDLKNIAKTVNGGGEAGTTATEAADTIATTMNTKAEQDNTVAKNENATAKGKSAIASGEEASADAADTTATIANTQAEKLNTAAKAEGTVAAQNAGKAIEEVATTTAAGSGIFATLKATIGGLAGAFGALVSAALPYLAIGGAIAGLAYLTWKDLNRDAIAADEAQKAANDLAQTAGDVATEYQEIQNSYQSLQDTITSYKQSEEAVDKLKKGTTEWKDALAEANNNVLSLLKSYPQLAGYLRKDSNGKLSIADEGLDNLQTELAQRNAYGQMAVAIAQDKANSAQIEANNKELQTKIKFTARNEAIKTDPRDVSQPTLAENNGATHNKYRAINDDELQAIYSMLKAKGDNSITSKSAIKEALAGTSQAGNSELINAIIENGDKIVAQLKVNEQLDQQNKEAMRNAAQNALNNTDGYDSNQKNNQAVVDLVAQAASNNIDKYQKDFESQDTETLGKLYAQQQGWTYKSEDGGKYKFTDASGQEQEVSKEVLTNYLAAAKAMNEAAANWQESAAQVAQISNSAVGSKYGEDAVNVIANGTKKGGFDFSSLSGSEIMSLQESDISASSLGISDDFAKQAGFKDANAYAEAFQKALNAYDFRDNDFLDSNWDSQKIADKLSSVGEDASKLDEYKQALKDTNSEFNNYASSVENNNLELEKQNEELTNSNKALDASSDEWKANRKQIDDNNKAIQKANDRYDELAAKIVVAQDGMDGLKKIFEETQNPLEGLDQNSADYTNTIEQISESLQNMLNIDMSNWSLGDKASFISSNLDDIRAAAEGDIDALQRLREAAASQILIEAGISPNTDANLYNGMMSIISWVNSQLPDLEAGATIDTGPFIEKLQEMISEGHYTASELETIFKALEGLGLDFDISYEATDISLPEIEVSAKKAAKGAKNVAEAAGAIIGSTISSVKRSIALPKIKSVVKMPNSSGSHNTGGSGGKGLGSTGGSGGSGGNKGGSGGGSGSSYTAKEKKEIDNEIDLYERVNTILEKVNNQYEQLNKERERLTGKKLAENISKETALLQRQIDVQKEKQQIQNKEAADLRNELSSNYGVQFDSEGYIANYADVYNKLVNKVNELGAKYPTLTSDDQEKALDKEYEAAEKALDKFNTKYKRYDELFAGDMEDTKKSIEDLQDSIEDLRINVLKTQVEAMDNLKDIQEKLVDFDRAFNRGIELTPYEEAQDSIAKLGKYFDVATMSANEYYDTLIKDQEEAMNAEGTSDAYKKWASNRIANLKAAKDRALAGDTSVDYYGTGYFDMSMKNLTDISEQMKQFNETGTSDIFGEDSADLYDVAKTVYEQATSLVSDYWSEIENLHGHITDMIDDISDRMDRRKDQYEAITDELQHQADIIELLHGEESYDDLNKVLGAQQNNYRVELSELMQQRDVWKDMLGTLEEGSEEWNTVSDKIKDATSDINDLIKDSLDNLQQQYTNTVSKITKAWTNKAVGTDLDWMNTQWELINRNADYYLDDVNKSYNIQKLQGKYLDLLDNSNDLSIQQKITNQMKEQLSYLRDKTKLSEYDVNYANAQLEILQKQIALEEAQRNKSQMKLRRDTQGNYSYVYTANDDNVRSAQSDLLDAQNNAYNLSKDQMKQTQSDSLSALQDAQSTINDIWNNANLSLEEKTARTKTIVDSLKEYLAGTSEQLSTSEKNIINDFIGMCDMLTDENKNNLQDTYDQIIQGNKDAFDQIDTRWSTSISDWLQNIDDFNTSTDDMFSQLIKNGQDYADSTKELADIAKTNFDDVSGAIENTNERTEELSKSTTDFINKLKDMSGEVAKSEATMQDYANRILDANNNMQAFKQQADDLANQLSKKEQENADLKTTISNYEKYGQATVPTGGGSGSGGAGGGTSEEIAFGIAQNIWTYGSWANDPVRRNRIIERYGEGVANRAQQIVNEYIYSGRAAQLYNPASGAYGYDTGGYTGTWSDKTAEKKDGKLAFLHQKELVLNSTDTANILAAVEAVRNFANSVKSNAISSSLGAAISQLARTKDDGNNSIEQNVHITAEFPAANSAAEIESALMSLNDRAVQYAYKIR